MGFMIDKTQAIGVVAIASVALGVSYHQGKLDKYIGKGEADTAGMFERKLPPPIEGADPLIPTEPTSEVSNEDVLAQVAGDDRSTGAFIEETASLAPTVSLEEDPLAAIASAPAGEDSRVNVGIAPVAQLASTDPSKIIAGAVAFTNVTPTVPAAPVDSVIAGPAGATVTSTGPRVFGAPSSASSPTITSPVEPTHVSTPAPIAQPALPRPLAPPAPNTLIANAGPAPSIPVSTSSPVLPGALPGPGGSTPVLPSESGHSSSNYPSNPAAAAAAIASLPSNATGKDLLQLQTQLTLLDKQKAIAAGHEAIAESRLKAAKAAYEMSQIGQPTIEERAAIASARAAAQAGQVQTVSAPPAPLTIDTARLLSTSRVGNGISATLNINGKLVDVKKGSVVSGLLVDKVTENSVVLIGNGKTQTVWID